jgi:hypothetical protein
VKKPHHINNGNSYRIVVNEIEVEDVKCTMILNEFTDDGSYYPPENQIVDIVPWHDRITKKLLGIRVYYRPTNDGND